MAIAWFPNLMLEDKTPFDIWRGIMGDKMNTVPQQVQLS